mmetsp:Transcript_43871/g.103751  ORF Transcript_43871/g.103751 Transcript_43871/m.103751 type:complete len:403 (+) Transcript_43871:93-1301(+)
MPWLQLALAGKGVAQSVVDTTVVKVTEQLQGAPGQQRMNLSKRASLDFRKEKRDAARQKLLELPGVMMRNMTQAQFLEQAPAGKQAKVCAMPPEVSRSWGKRALRDDAYGKMPMEYMMTEVSQGFSLDDAPPQSPNSRKRAEVANEHHMFMATREGIPVMEVVILDRPPGGSDLIPTFIKYATCNEPKDDCCCFPCCCFFLWRCDPRDVEVRDPWDFNRVIGRLGPVRDLPRDGSCAGCVDCGENCLRTVLCCAQSGWDARDQAGERVFRVQDGHPYLNLCGLGNCLCNAFYTPNCCLASRQQVLRGPCPIPMLGCPCDGAFIANAHPYSCCTCCCSCAGCLRLCTRMCCAKGSSHDNYTVKFPKDAGVDERLLLVAATWMSFTYLGSRGVPCGFCCEECCQ